MIIKIKRHVNKSFLFLYRCTAIVLLYGVLIGVGSYLFMQGFYALNHSWVAPIIVSPSNEVILQMTSQIVLSQSQLNALILDRNRLQDSLHTMKEQRAELQEINSELDVALTAKSKDDATNGGELTGLIEQKRSDIMRTSPIISEAVKTENRIEMDLAAGVITKGDAAIQRATLAQFANAYTDSKVGEILLRDNVRQKTTMDVDTLDILSKLATLKSSIAQLDVNITIGEQQLRTDETQIAGIERIMKTEEQSPFYVATQASDRLKFAFVPYENEDGIEAGSRIYDCYLNMIVCRDVGAVKAIYTDEQKTSHPLFRNEMRGFLVQLDLTKLESAKSKTLFVNRKPLLL